MSEFVLSDGSEIFSEKYWQPLDEGLPPDKRLRRSRLKGSEYPHLAAALIGYLRDEGKSVELPPGTLFDPNGAPGSWFIQEGTLLLFDRERFRVYTPERFEKLPKLMLDRLVDFPDVASRLALPTRDFLLKDWQPDWYQGLGIEASERVFVARPSVSEISTYERQVRAGVMQSQNDSMNCLGITYTGKSVEFAVFRGMRAPFAVGQTIDIPPKESWGGGVLREFQRVKNLVVIETSPGKSRGRRKRVALGVGRLGVEPQFNV